MFQDFSQTLAESDLHLVCSTKAVSTKFLGPLKTFYAIYCVLQNGHDACPHHYSIIHRWINLNVLGNQSYTHRSNSTGLYTIFPSKIRFYSLILYAYTRLDLLTTKPETQKNQECRIISGKLWLCFCKWRKTKIFLY